MFSFYCSSYGDGFRKLIIELKNHEKKYYKCKTLRPHVPECSFQKEKKLVKILKINGNHESCKFEEIIGEPAITGTIKSVDSEIRPVTEWDALPSHSAVQE